MEAFSGSLGSRFQVYSDGGRLGKIWGTIRDQIYIEHKNIWGKIFKILLRKNYRIMIYGITMQAY